ncbi:MAG: endolytic transglycosylase MltG [Syntrophaceae bacterium]|nr:endolytic transglycosylase MltG [Syntrophaceae bacterium]
MKKSLKKFLWSVFLLPVFGAVIFGVCLFLYAYTPLDSGETKTVLVDIPTGTSFIKTTELLDKAGLVKNKNLFYSLAALKNAIRSIRAGEYEFSTSLSPSEMIDKLLHGDIKKYHVTVYEDSSLKDVAYVLRENKLIDEKMFFRLASDRQFLLSLDIRGHSVEGYLFPDTYYLNRSMTTRQIIQTMVKRFWAKVTPDMLHLAARRGLTPHQLVTFASLVGKETGYSAEKPMIAGVFYNRLKKGMPLQSDPTAVYDMQNFKGKILRSHLKRESPYNTYVIKGLPPGPIANPGMDSLKAVLNPAEVNYLYFVARGDGTHFFSASFPEHVNAILRIRSGIGSSITNPGNGDTENISTEVRGDGA